MSIRKWQWVNGLPSPKAMPMRAWIGYRRIDYIHIWIGEGYAEVTSAQFSLEKDKNWSGCLYKEGKSQHQRRLATNMVQKRQTGKQKSKMFWAAFEYGVCTQLVPMEGDPRSKRWGVTVLSSSRLVFAFYSWIWEHFYAEQRINSLGTYYTRLVLITRD